MTPHRYRPIRVVTEFGTYGIVLDCANNLFISQTLRKFLAKAQGYVLLTATFSI